MTFDLEERTCDGGCGRKFKCLPSSPMHRASAYCETKCFKGKYIPAQLKALKDTARTFNPKSFNYGRKVRIEHKAIGHIEEPFGVP